MTNLIERLRRKGSVFVAKDCHEAADALEAADKEIKARSESIDYWQEAATEENKKVIKQAARIEELEAVVDVAKDAVNPNHGPNKKVYADQRLATALAKLKVIDDD